MIDFRKKIIILMLCGGVLLIGCVSTSTSTVTPTLEITATDILETPVPLETDTPVPTVTHTETTSPSETPEFPTETLLNATLTIAPTDMPYLASRSPSQEELQKYIDPLGMGEFGTIARVLTDDVSGDGEDDLIVVMDQAPVFVFIWQGDRYSLPSQTGAWKEGLLDASGRYLYLKDYTEDGVPEVVNDSWFLRGEEDYIAVDWERQITYCQQEGCHVIWEDWIETYGNAPLSSGIFYYHSVDYVYEDNDQIILERRYSGLTVYWPYIGADREPVLSQEYNAATLGWDTSEKYYRDVDVIRRYAWDGETYVFLDDRILMEPELIAYDMLHESEGPRGIPIEIQYRRDTLSYEERGNKYRNDRCHVYVNGEPVSDQFLCKYNLTKMEWRDVVDTPKDELVITTVAGDQSYIWPEMVVERGCFHQRMLVYKWEGITPTLIADITGCVRSSDLFGVKIEDFDEDGDFEIIAAPPWMQFLEQDQPDGISQNYMQVNQLVEIYEWDGEKFIPEWALDN